MGYWQGKNNGIWPEVGYKNDKETQGDEDGALTMSVTGPKKQ